MMLIMMMVVMMMSFSVREAVSKEVRNDIVEQCSANPYLTFITSTNSIVSVNCKKSSSKFRWFKYKAADHKVVYYPKITTMCEDGGGTLE